MDWMNQLSGLMGQYAGANAQQHPQTVDDDFDQFTQQAPQSALSQGLAGAFRSSQTPPFGNMVSNLFANSSGQQRASILNTLLAAAGPMVLQQVMSRMGGGGGGGTGAGNPLGGLAGLLGGLGGGGGQQPHITPQQAEQISPQVVEEIAAQAETQDPSVIDRVSDFYAEHPTLVKGLGAAALAVALAKIAQSQQR